MFDRKKPPTQLKVLDNEFEYTEMVNSSKRIAKRIAPMVTKDTLVVGVDKGARFVIHPLRKALAENGVEVPRVHFINYSSVDTKFRNPLKKKENLFEEVSERLKRIEKEKGKPFSNVVIVDEFAASGKTLRSLQKAFIKATGKPVHTVAFAIDDTPIYPISEVDFSNRIYLPLSNIRDRPNIVKDAEKPEKKMIRKTLPNREGIKPYKEYIEKINAEFEKQRSEHERTIPFTEKRKSVLQRFRVK